MEIIAYLFLLLSGIGFILLMVSWFTWAFSSNEEKSKNALRSLPWGLVLLFGGLTFSFIIGITM